MPTDMLIILVLIIVAIIFTLAIDLNGDRNGVVLGYVVYTDDLEDFENYYLNTLAIKYAQKAEKIANPTRAFSNDGNIFEGLSPWSSPADFGVAMHTLIGYGVRLRTAGDPLYDNPVLAANLYGAVVMIYLALPYPAPVHSAPWGPRTDWYHFSITMPECLQNTCIVLRGYYDISDMVEHILYYYLPEPTVSMGWRRTAGNAMRMGLPYAYGQLLRGYSYTYIRDEPEMVYVLNLIRFPLVPIGNGIHYDYAYFDHTDVRAYGYLLNSFFTFSYYNFLFGDEVVHMENLNASINLIGSETGYVNPAVLSRQGSNYSNVIGSFIAYNSGVVSADFSKILTVRTPLYFGSVVGQTPGVAYYEADENNSLHAPLWAMTRKIWANNGRVVRYRTGMLGLESGIILTSNLSGVWSVPTTGPSTSSFHPTFAQTAICTTADAGVMVSRVRLEELNLAFDSYTLYHSKGMFQLYDKILAIAPIAHNARCIVLTKDLSVDSEPWSVASNVAWSNLVTARHINIANNASFSNFAIRTFDSARMQTLEQLIGSDSINAGRGMSCFSLTVSGVDDDTQAMRVPHTDAFVVTTGHIELAVLFPLVVLKDNVSNRVTINDANSNTRNTHELLFSTLNVLLSFVRLNVDDLYSESVKRTHDRFIYDNTQANQFNFVFAQSRLQ
ncbi:ODV-E66 [Betabaculovirus altermyunipunctae]|uniref:ODV-E66 n=1 Tax=Betabaculovirus altermyunipunctae TaxID=3051996 RepID=A0A1S5YE17_9BBAC|nr:ODV-E66 [Betabaculovirus altermyunipunctae]AQQ80400.1 ODV-E66 [Betabaculovirus altermyunipunctae]